MLLLESVHERDVGVEVFDSGLAVEDCGLVAERILDPLDEEAFAKGSDAEVQKLAEAALLGELGL